MDYCMPPVAMEFDFAPSSPSPEPPQYTSPSCSNSAITEPDALDPKLSAAVCDFPASILDPRSPDNSTHNASKATNDGCGAGLAQTIDMEDAAATTATAVSTAAAVVAAAEVAPMVPNVYAILNNGPPIENRAMLQPLQQQQGNGSSAIGRRSGREKKLSAKAIAVALIAQQAAEERERKYLESKAAEAAAQVEAIQEAAGVLLDMNLYGEQMHDMHAMRMKLSALTQDAAEHAYAYMHTHSDFSRATTPIDTCVLSGGMDENVGPLHMLTDIALAQGDWGDATAGGETSGGNHQQRCNPSSSGWGRGSPSQSGHTEVQEGTSFAGAVSSSCPMNLTWGGKRLRSKCAARFPRKHFASIISAVSVVPIGAILVLYRDSMHVSTFVPRGSSLSMKCSRQQAGDRVYKHLFTTCISQQHGVC